MRAIALLIATCALAIPAFAEEPVPGQTKFFEWICVPASKPGLRDLTFGSERARINNISVKESKELITDAPTLKLSASLANRTDQKVSASIEVVGMEGKAPVFAVSARPVFGFTQPQENEELAAYVMAPRGALAKVDTFCIRAAAYAGRK